ncbi:MAG: hypothetical protein WBC85_07895 [Planktotalea sp.]|uniref:hypothetical protein n=1 Tax=Planktotalea sp. TaxID=2029877 RepID=UPI003C7582EC
MKSATVALCVLMLASTASAQSGFGSSDVTSGDGVSAADSFDLTGLTPEDQTPTGKFTTAAEIGQILELTKDSWTAVREYDGQDLVYFSHIFSWRCGLKAAKFSINDEPLRDLEMPECHMQFKQPNAILNDEALMTFQRYELGSVKSIRIDVLLDNLTVQSVTLLRENILIP